MKKRSVAVIMATVILGSVLFTSCIGSFGLTNKLYGWNKSVGSKFVNELVFFAMVVIPVYEVTMFVDGIVLNSIEFWSGNNPVAAGEIKTIKGEKDIFMVEALENGYKIQNSTGDEISLVCDESNTWSVVTKDISAKLLKVVDEDNAVVYLANGKEMNVPLSEAGVLAFRQAVDQINLVAFK